MSGADDNEPVPDGYVALAGAVIRSGLQVHPNFVRSPEFRFWCRSVGADPAAVAASIALVQTGRMPSVTPEPDDSPG